MMIYKKPYTREVTFSRYVHTSNVIKEYFRDTPLKDIKKIDYQLFLNTYSRSRATETVRKLHNHIRSAVADALDNKIILLDFTRNAVIKGEAPSKKPEEKYLNYGEAELLLNHLKKRLTESKSQVNYILFIALLTGMRYAEIVALTWNDIDFENRTISVTKSWDYKYNYSFTTTKNDVSRIVHVDPMTIQVLEILKLQHENNFLNLIFFSPKAKSKVISNELCNRMLKQYCQELKINPISFHGLRHTHASILIYKGVSIHYISERLGHSTIQTTLDHYSHLLKELKEEDITKTLKSLEELVL